MLELMSSIECKEATATVLFFYCRCCSLATALVIISVLWSLEMMSELVDLRCKDPDFFFRTEKATLAVAMSSLQRGG